MDSAATVAAAVTAAMAATLNKRVCFRISHVLVHGSLLCDGVFVLVVAAASLFLSLRRRLCPCRCDIVFVLVGESQLRQSHDPSPRVPGRLTVLRGFATESKVDSVKTRLRRREFSGNRSQLSRSLSVSSYINAHSAAVLVVSNLYLLF